MYYDYDSNIFTYLETFYLKGDINQRIRKNCTQVFRKLIPIAPLAKQQYLSGQRDPHTLAVESQAHSNSDAHANVLMNQIYLRNKVKPLNESDHSVDREIVKQFLDMSTCCLREYQWVGVTWLTQLRRQS